MFHFTLQDIKFHLVLTDLPTLVDRQQEALTAVVSQRDRTMFRAIEYFVR